VVVILGGCAALRALVPEKRPFGVPERAIRIPGPESRAAGVAFNDFAVEIAKEKAEAETYRGLDGGTAPDGGPSPEELARLQAESECIGQPGFYDTWVYLDDAGTRYVVELWPKPEVCYGKDVEFYGGGAAYEIDAKSFEILKKELGE